MLKEIGAMFLRLTKPNQGFGKSTVLAENMSYWYIKE